MDNEFDKGIDNLADSKAMDYCEEKEAIEEESLYSKKIKKEEPLEGAFKEPDKIEEDATEEEAFEPKSYEEAEKVYNKTEEFYRKRNAERYEEKIKEHKPSRKASGGWRKIIAVAVIIGVLGGLFSGIGYGIATKDKPAEEVEERLNEVAEKQPEEKKNTGVYEGEIYSSKDIIKIVSPAVVNINVESRGTTTYWGMYEVPYSYKGAGSGVIFSESDEEVYIITNSHVIAGVSNIHVTLDEAENIPASIIGNDSESELAVLSISKADLSEQGVERVTIASLGDSDALEVGDSVIAIGNALGLGKVSTGGMISALSKTIDIEGKILDVIQTDAAINEGNSGGALVNEYGEVIGINTAKSLNIYSSVSTEGMGYAIPINTAKPIIESLLEEGTGEKPYLGIVGNNVTEELAKVYGLPMGVYIAQVLEGGAAEKGGIQVGDVIIEFNGKKIVDMDVLIAALKETKVGDKVSVRIIRDKEPMEIKIEIADGNAR